jgi:hypothetical protein
MIPLSHLFLKKLKLSQISNTTLNIIINDTNYHHTQSLPSFTLTILSSNFSLLTSHD